MTTSRHDVIVIGAGAAGLSCAGRLGSRAVVLEHNVKPGLKVLISGGGRCNFTNLHCGHEQFVSGNPHFPRNALAFWSARDTLDWVENAGIDWHEKHRGQLFCDHSSKDILNLLLSDCETSGVDVATSCEVRQVEADNDGFTVTTSKGQRQARAVVLACGGLSYPRLGVSDLGYRVARHFGHALVPPTPALVGLMWPRHLRNLGSRLSGVALPVRGTVNGVSFDEDLLFTHAGLSGPAILQLSNYWNPGDTLHLDLAPIVDLAELLQRDDDRDKGLVTVLGRHLPRRLATALVSELGLGDHKLKQLQHPDRHRVTQRVHRWELVPEGTTGWDKAEVTRGGVRVDEVHPKTFESRRQPGLHLIGEVLDVTGWLGGYNLQWAFASGRSCGEALRHRL